MRNMNPFSRFANDRRGIAAAEFALIAPALIFLVMGVFEMSFRFRASEEATRYVHQVADIISRESELTTEAIGEIYDAAVFMMKPLKTTDNLDLDVASIGFVGDDADPEVMWRRVAGTSYAFDVTEAAGMGIEDETVVRVGVRYNYSSVLTELFGGGLMAIEKTAYSRPRIDRKISIDGEADDGGAIQYISD